MISTSADVAAFAASVRSYHAHILLREVRAAMAQVPAALRGEFARAVLPTIQAAGRSLYDAAHTVGDDWYWRHADACDDLAHELEALATPT